MSRAYQAYKRWNRSATFNDYDELTTAASNSPSTTAAAARHSFPGTSAFSMPHERTRRTSIAPRPSEVPGPAYPFHAMSETAASFVDVWYAVMKFYNRARANVHGFTFFDWMQVCLPCLKWLRVYNLKEYLLWDIIAGVSVGFMVVPQGMSYAHIAGLPSVYGLYGAFMPVIMYALFGGSRELAVGPVAVTSLLISSTLRDVVTGAEHITDPNSPPDELVPIQEMYNQRAIQLSLLVACFYTAVGVLNLGFLTNFLSHSVIGGFTSGAAIIIGLSQLKYILGYNVPKADKVPEQIQHYIEGIKGLVWQECVMGISLLMLLLLMKHLGKKHRKLRWLRPLGPISACLIGITAVLAGNLDSKGIRTVGKIPRGLPAPTVSWWLPMDDFSQLVPLALVVMLVDLLESTSVARSLASKGRYELKANQEIISLGLANFAGSAFNAYSTTGSFSRSAVNYDSGCKTCLSGLVTACVVGLVLVALTPMFERLPLNVMGAIVISAVSGLFEYEQAVHLFKVRKLDWLVWMTSWAGTMLLGVVVGLAIAIGLALLIVIYESAFPHTALLGRVGNTTIYRNVKQFPNSQVLPGIAACRVDAPMYFANVQYIHDRLRKYVARATAYSEVEGLRLQYLLLDMSPVTHLDSTGADLLKKLHQEMQEQGIQLALCNPGATVINLLERTSFPDTLGRDWIFVRMHDAVQRCLSQMLAKGQTVRPTCAMHSAAVSPKHLEALQNSPLRRHSTLGGPEDSEATWLGPAGPFMSPFAGMTEPLLPSGSETFIAGTTPQCMAGSAPSADTRLSSNFWSQLGTQNVSGSDVGSHGAANRPQLHAAGEQKQIGEDTSAGSQQHPTLDWSSARGRSRLSGTWASDAADVGGDTAQRSGEVLLLLNDLTDSVAPAGWSRR